MQMDERQLKVEGARWYQVGCDRCAEGKTEEAIDAFAKATTFDPQHAEAHYTLGVYLAQSSRYEEALRAWKRAVWLEPDYLHQLIQAFDLDHDLKESVVEPVPLDKGCPEAA